jgi:MFS superfamily sulfate permease-like transporter
MRILQAAFTFVLDRPGSWTADWAWGLPLIVLTVLIHVLGLGLVKQRALRFSTRRRASRHPIAVFVTVMGSATLLATALHGIETGIWAAAYRVLGALPDFRTAMLYSLNAVTSYGHTNVDLAKHWELMGALEALNGWLLFGLTTAFLFGILEKVWVTDGSGKRP